MRKQLEGKYLPKVNYHFFPGALKFSHGEKSTLKQELKTSHLKKKNFYFFLLILNLEVFFLKSSSVIIQLAGNYCNREH